MKAKVMLHHRGLLFSGKSTNYPEDMKTMFHLMWSVEPQIGK